MPATCHAQPTSGSMTMTSITHGHAERPTDLCIVGAGYVGLTAAACFADLGHRVRCLEASPARLGLLRRGRSE
ncbi:MAG: NAD-binding protein, partial [Chloroflexi bacterium]|nr:NAD-binding protein [Chloroflexota bacterium]